MKDVQQCVDEAKAAGMRKAFITFHYPTFARSGLGPIPAPDNPHKAIAAYANDMEVVVFNGHVHTTEMYDVGGGAAAGRNRPQFSPVGRASSCPLTIRRTSIGRGSRQRRSTTTSW